jgi:chromosomal replication initiator protein
MFDDDFMWDEEDQVVLFDSRGMTPRQANMIAMNDIAKEYDYTAEDIIGKNRSRKLVEIRRKCAVMLREKGYSTTEIGRIMNRDHSTIVHSLKIMAQKQ